jgi:poly-beta-1,6-N-acetyl-D-glucosamine synthase
VSPVRLTVIVSFLNEASFLPRLLASVERQTRLPDGLVLVDDGSTDGSAELAAAFAARHDFVRVLHRSTRRADADRLADAAELRSFDWAVRRLDEPWDVLAKLDADLELNPRHFECLVDALRTEPDLGIVGAHLSEVGEDGTVARTPAPRWHVRGATKFYRRECYEQIAPIPAHLGWDMIDGVKARRLGWRTASLEVPGHDTLHLRPTGAHDGRLRAFRRWGECAWGYGAHPVFVLLGAAKRLSWRPYVVGGVLYAAGYASAGLRGAPRADRDLRAYLRSEEALRVRGAMRGAQTSPRARSQSTVMSTPSSKE